MIIFICHMPNMMYMAFSRPDIKIHNCNLVGSAISHTLVSKIKPCMSKFKYFSLKLQMAHYISSNLFDSPYYLDICSNSRATCVICPQWVVLIRLKPPLWGDVVIHNKLVDCKAMLAMDHSCFCPISFGC
jgi:hypothetical protein